MIRPFFKVMLHILASVGVLCGLGLLFFNLYLPWLTEHGQVTTVPNLMGLHISEVENVLKKHMLVLNSSQDSSFSLEHLPATVLKQSPVAGISVKKQRKVTIILNASRPPLVKMPDLVDGSVKHAQIMLQNAGLRLGHIHYVPDLAQNAVLEAYWQGAPISAHTPIPQHSIIELEVGKGTKRRISIPNVFGLPTKQAQSIIISAGLRVGAKHKYLRNSSDTIAFFEENIVLKQDPLAREQHPIGTFVELWISETAPSLSPKDRQP